MADVIFSDEEESKTVMDYQPKKLSLGISTQAIAFIGSQPQHVGTSFRISELVAQQTGIQELEKASLEKRIELKALERLKEIQESAYREAYDLGLEEGQKKGYEEAKQTVSDQLLQLNVLLKKFTTIKVDILQRNEIQIIDLIYYLATKVATFEIEKNKDRVLPVLKNAIESLQKDETMLIKLAPEDLAVIEELKKTAANDFEFLSKAKLESGDDITPGGCLIETSYGLIDASLEERLKKLWETLDAVKPSSKRDTFE